MEGKCPLGAHLKMEALMEKFCNEIQEIKGISEKQWDIIAKKASVSAIKWGVTVFVVLILATVGFLWNNQREIKNEIVSEVKSLSIVIAGDGGLKDKVKELGWKLDGHLEKAPHKNNPEPGK